MTVAAIWLGGLAAWAAPPAAADTHVGGSIVTDANWTAAGSPYVLDADVTVGAAATLTIDPGVTVVASSETALEVFGGLVADGTEAAPIRFTSPAQWRGIRLRSGPAATLDHVTIEWAEFALDTERTTTVSASRILDATWGIATDGVSLTVTDSTFARMSAAVLTSDDRGRLDVHLARNRFFQTGGVRLRGATDATVTGNLFQNGSGAISFWSHASPWHYEFTDNTLWAIRSDAIETRLTDGGGSRFTAKGNSIFAGFRQWDWLHSSSEPGDPLQDIDVADNWWGTTDAAQIDARIRDGWDDAQYPFVRYAPTLLGPSITAPAPNNSPAPDTVIDSAPPPPARDLVTIEFHGLFASGESGSFECTFGQQPGEWRRCRPGAIALHSAGEGERTFWVRALSDAGTPDPTPATVVVVHDSVGPALVWTERPPARTNADPVRIAWTSSEPATFTCALDDIPLESCDPPLVLDDLDDGQHEFVMRATDALGNGADLLTGFYVDRTPPGPLALREPTAGSVVTTAATRFSWSPAEHEFPSPTYQLVIDGHARPPTYPCDSQACSVELADITDGAHTWAVTVSDAVGNSHTAPSRGFVLDRTAPEPFEPVAPAARGFIGAGGAVSWQEAVDAASGIDRYEVYVDETHVATAHPPTLTAQLPAALAQGPHVWRVVAVDRAGHERGTVRRELIVDATPPVAALTASPRPAAPGDTITLDASASRDDVSPIARYEWDLDGDGSFETDGGAVPTVTLTRDQTGTLAPAVRVTDSVGLTDVATVAIQFTPRPPGSTPGVTINDRATFTTSPDVTLSVVWPAGATEVVVSNDGGFAASSTFPVAAAIPWQLVSTGPERLPKTVYVRFRGPAAGAETYQDDILLDQTPPELISLELTPAAGRRYALRTHARDAGSGVARVQLREPAAAAPFGEVPYGRTPLVRTESSSLLVRVLDRAGNASAWRTVAPRPAVRLHAQRLAVRRGRRLLIRYTVGRPGTAVLRIMRGNRTLGYATQPHERAGSAYFRWNGRFARRLARRGTYTVSLAFTSAGRTTTDRARLRVR